jgi:hypothetical protein
MTAKQQMGRLAMRVEGDLWVAYYALPNTMEGAIFLGSIQMAFVQDFANKEIFMALMRDAVGAMIKGTVGADAIWPDPNGVPAPEHERGGRA